MDAAIIRPAAAAKLPRSVPILVRTNLGTNISFTVSEEDATRDLKRRIVMEHAYIHPEIGDIKILQLKVKWGKSLFTLSDSMRVRDAFHWIKGAWILYVDATSSAAATDRVATSVDNQTDPNGGECTIPFKIASKTVNNDAFDPHVSLTCNDQGRSKSPDSKHHQQNPSVAMNKITETSNYLLVAKEKVQAPANMDGLEMTTASHEMERGGDKSGIQGNSVSAIKLADRFGEPQQNQTETEQKMERIRKSSEPCATFNDPDELISSSITGVTDFNIVEKPSSATVPDPPQNGNALSIGRNPPTDISKVKLPGISSSTRFDVVADISANPVGANPKTSHKRKKKSSYSQKNLNGKHGMIYTSSATHENVSDTRKPVESSPLSESMDKKQCLSPHLVSVGKVTEKSKDALLAAETVGCVYENLLDDTNMMIDSATIEKGEKNSDIHVKSFETVELADQSVEPQKNVIQAKKKKKRSRKLIEPSAASEDPDHNGLPNIVMTVVIGSGTAEIPPSAGVRDSFVDGNTLPSSGTPVENLKFEPTSGKSIGTGYVEELDAVSQNPKETHLEVPHKHRRKSLNRRKKIGNHGKSDSLSAVIENVNHTLMTPGESAAPSDVADKKQQKNEQTNKTLEATNVNPLEFEKVSPVGIQEAQDDSESNHAIKGLAENQIDANTNLLGKIGDSHEKESDASPLVDKTPIGNEKLCRRLILDNPADLPVSMGKKQQRRKRKSEKAVETDVNSFELEKGSFSGIKGTQNRLEASNLNKGLDSSQMYPDIEFPGVKGSHDKQSKELLFEKTSDDHPVDEQNCNSILGDKSAASSDARNKKRQQSNRKKGKTKAENVTSSELCSENQGTEKNLEAYSLNQGLDGNANTDLPEEINGSPDEKSDTLPLLNQTTNHDPPGEVTTDVCSELPRASIKETVFMEIFAPQESATSLAVEENPGALKSVSGKPPKTNFTSRRSIAQKEDISADAHGDHSQVKHKKKSRLETLSNHKERSDGSSRQQILQEDNTEKRHAVISTADEELDNKLARSNNGRRQVKPFLSKVDADSDMGSPIASGACCENAVSISKGHESLHKGKNSISKSGATAYSDQTLVAGATKLKIAVPSLSSASTEDNSTNTTSCYRVAFRENSQKTPGDSSRAAREDGIFSARDMFSNNFNNMTSEDGRDADNPAAKSGSRSNSKSQQEFQFSNSRVIDSRDISYMKNVDTKSRSGKDSSTSRSKQGRLKLGDVLRDTRAYKKISALIASESQELDANGECPDLVPESQF